jgi:DNA-binding response OmpR family regulator
MIQTDSGHDVVIIAEDDQNQSLMLKDYLETVFGLQIFTAETTSSVIPLVKEKNASVLILDLQLADGDAEHLVPEAAAIDGLLVVVLTGTWQERMEDELLQAGAQVVMRKPQKPSTVWAQISNLMDRHPQIKSSLKIGVKGTDEYIDLKEGAIIGTDGRNAFFSEERISILKVLAQNLDEASSSSGGWVERNDIIKNVYGNIAITEDVGNSLRYNIREINKAILDVTSCSEDHRPIENRRMGREDSFYRLSPEVFEDVKEGS